MDFSKKELIKAWIKQGDNSSDNFMKFMSYWVAFNAICYELYKTEAGSQLSPIIKNLRKFDFVKQKLNNQDTPQIDADKAQLRLTPEGQVNLSFTDMENESFIIRIREKYREDFIFKQFSKDFDSKIQISSDDFSRLKQSLTKYHGVDAEGNLLERHYVINMARSGDYFRSRDPEEQEGVVTICEENNLQVLVGVLYIIRCNVFHGGKNPIDQDDFSIVSAAIPVIKTIVNHFFEIDDEQDLVVGGLNPLYVKQLYLRAAFYDIVSGSMNDRRIERLREASEENENLTFNIFIDFGKILPREAYLREYKNDSPIHEECTSVSVYLDGLRIQHFLDGPSLIEIDGHAIYSEDKRDLTKKLFEQLLENARMGYFAQKIPPLRFT